MHDKSENINRNLNARRKMQSTSEDDIKELQEKKNSGLMMLEIVTKKKYIREK